VAADISKGYTGSGSTMPQRCQDGLYQFGSGFLYARGLQMSDPYCLAMVLCDWVHRDGTSGKATILGTFSVLRAPEFPTKLSFWVYFSLTDILGEFNLTLRIVDSEHEFIDENEPIVNRTAVLTSPSPLVVHEGAIQVKNLEIPRPGVYHCELLNGAIVLMSRRLAAVSTAIGDEDGNDH
jgi:hypothetical protein